MEQPAAPPESDGMNKGLKVGAIGLVSTAVIALASTAPGYSLASAIQPIGSNAGVQTPVIMALAFVPMFFIAYAYKELNAVNPDCGTTFSWGAKAFGGAAGWMGGWAIVAADVIVMANLAEIAGQYTFDLFGATGIGSESRGWVTVVGALWIVIMTWICWRGIEISAKSQIALFGVELTMILLFAVVALVKVSNGHGISTSVHPSWSWFNPLDISSFSTLSTGLLTAVFIYWGWDTAVSINEETDDKEKTPGRAALLSTVILLVTYVFVSTGIVAFAGTAAVTDPNSTSLSLGNANNSGDALSILGTGVFGSHGIGWFLAKLLILAILSSAAASTQTTILPTARTTLSMAVWKALPSKFGTVHTRYQTPTWSTWGMGAISLLFYVAMSYVAGGKPLNDLILCIGLLIAFYYGMTGFACVWYFRRAMKTPRQILSRGILPGLGGLILLALFVKASMEYYKTSYGSTSFDGVGGVFILGYVSLAIGAVLMLVWFKVSPGFFRKGTSGLPRGFHTDSPFGTEAIVGLGEFVLDQGAPAEADE
jgi:amino acid transporter